MINKIKNHPFQLLLAILAILILAEYIAYFSWGYNRSGLIYILLGGNFINDIRFVLFAICTGWVIWSIIKRQYKYLFAFIWVVLLLLNSFPKEQFYPLGGVASMHAADPDKVLIDARTLLNEYEPMTHFGFPQRPPLDKPLPLDNLPASLNIEIFSNVLVLENYVLIEKHGLGGVFRGYVAFREGFDLWENEGRISLFDTCSICWKIRIIDGLYWYNADPMEPPIFISSLE